MRAAAARMGWLDALRGVAALLVAVHHFGMTDLFPFRKFFYYHFDLGIYAVMLFFLVSGYIVPASLERRGDVRGFWIGRLFRIYPLLIVTVTAALLFLPRDFQAVPEIVLDHPVRSAAANILLLHEMLRVPSALGPMWSLCYEMIFYFLVAALFTVNQHRRSAELAIGFSAAALLLGAAVAPTLISVDRGSTRNLITATAVVVVAAMAAIISGRVHLVRLGSLMLGGLGLVLAFANGRSTFFESMTIFATMFAGTVIFRMEKGQLDRLTGWFCLGFVLVCGVAVGYLYNHGGALHRTWTNHWTGFSLPYLAAWLTFGAGMLLRNRRFPRFLTWLGSISYSVYVVHVPVMFAVWWALRKHHFPQTGLEQFVPSAVFLSAVVATSYLTYRLVELPGQNLGRRIAKTLDRRLAGRP